MDTLLQMNLAPAFECPKKRQNADSSYIACKIPEPLFAPIARLHHYLDADTQGMPQCKLPDVPFLCGWGGWEQDYTHTKISHVVRW